jgi:hypothetical protein
MSARAKARAQARDAAERERADAALRKVRERLPAPGDWLHGWPLLEGGLSVLMGTGVYCAGCGRWWGVTTVAIDEDWTPPDRTPEWPFPQDDCPVCRAGY